MRGKTTRVMWRTVVGGIVLAGIFGGRGELWPSGVNPLSQSGLSSTAQAALSEAESLQSAFIRVGEQVGPGVVSISTEQIERVKRYFRVHPFMGDRQFDEFFRHFYGEAPEQELRRYGLGSGVIINADGFILTNEHVVAGADKITVTLANGQEFIGEVKGTDPRSDLAVVKIDATDLRVVVLGDSSVIKAGQWVVALGNPLGLAGLGVPSQGAEPTLSVGVISALHRKLPRTSQQDRDYSNLIQTDATINPGNSGGPLVNLDGQVIGVNVAILVGPGNAYGFAIPINKAKNILERLIAGTRVVYGWLGIQIQDITKDVADYYELSEQEGVLVYQVLPDSPAHVAGMKDGDIVKAFDGMPIRHTQELIDRVSLTEPGRRVSVEILRDRKRRTLQVKIGERPVGGALVEGSATEAWRGLRVGALTTEHLEQFDLPARTTGVLVHEVESDSLAEEAGLRPGDIINEISRIRTEDVSSYRKAIAKVKNNAALVRTNRGYFVIKIR